MAKLRKACAYRRLERPFTRKSKYKSKSFVKATPHNRIVKYIHGNTKKKFEYTLLLNAGVDIQLRQNALESARKTTNQMLEASIGTTAYMLKLRLYPHHILRENPLAAGAGADRMSTGMSHSFGKPIGLAAQVLKGKPVMQLDVDEKDLGIAKIAMRNVRCKLPCGCRLEVIKNSKE